MIEKDTGDIINAVCGECRYIDECDGGEYECPGFKAMERFRQVLEKIAYPLKYFREEADRQGYRLNGVAAVEISNDAAWLKTVAEGALRKE